MYCLVCNIGLPNGWVEGRFLIFKKIFVTGHAIAKKVTNKSLVCWNLYFFRPQQDGVGAMRPGLSGVHCPVPLCGRVAAQVGGPAEPLPPQVCLARGHSRCRNV